MSLQFEIDAAVGGRLQATFDAIPSEDQFSAAFLGPPGHETYARALELPDPRYPDQPEAEIDEATIDAFLSSDTQIVRKVVEALSDPVDSSQRFTFLLWDGWGWDPKLPTDNRVHLGGIRSYTPARGSLAEWREWMADQHEAYEPGHVWPDDRAWCVAFDVDAHFAGVGASASAIERLTHLPELTVVPWSWGSSPALYG